jgi:GTPase SAR1 family protein
VGKTTLFKSFLDEPLDETVMKEKGKELYNLQLCRMQTIDFRIKSSMVDERPIKYYIWDTAG